MAEQPKKKKDIISEWRERHLAELDHNLDTWKSIRDNPKSEDKNRIEAGKAIARQMGALSPDVKKTEKEERAEDVPRRPALQDEHSKELEALLDAL